MRAEHPRKTVGISPKKAAFALAGGGRFCYDKERFESKPAVRDKGRNTVCMKKMDFAAMRRKYISYEYGCRLLMTVGGVLLSGFSVGFLQIADFGTDPFTVFATGIANVFGVTYGTLYPYLNLVLLAAMCIYGRHYIGIATVINLMGIGFMADFSRGLWVALTPDPTMAQRVGYIVIGLIILCLACSMYMTSDLGVSTYDVVAISLSKLNTPIQFRFWRIGTDCICVLVGFLLGATVGVGTVFTAFCMGPVIQLFNKILWDPLIMRLQSMDIHRLKNKENAA